MPDPDKHTELVARDWKQSAYYDWAETPDYLALFWSEGSPFLRMFRRMDRRRLVEIACGHGRHVPHYASDADAIVLVDVNAENIDFCKQRFSTLKKLRFEQNGGSDLNGIGAGSCTAVFSYDAMVHFELLDVAAYLRETERVLEPGGMALFHHSNFTGIVGLPHNSDHRFGWRNYMNAELFTHLAMRAGLLVVEQELLDWGGHAKLDGLTLLRKPGR